MQIEATRTGRFGVPPRNKPVDGFGRGEIQDKTGFPDPMTGKDARVRAAEAVRFRKPRIDGIPGFGDVFRAGFSEYPHMPGNTRDCRSKCRQVEIILHAWIIIPIAGITIGGYH